jgi:hypothetical protein
MLSASDTKMKKLLLTGAAALFLATVAARADNIDAECGRL